MSVEGWLNCGLFHAGGERGVGFEDGGRELLPTRALDQSLADVVKEKRVEIVEFVESHALLPCDETITADRDGSLKVSLPSLLLSWYT